MLKWFFGCDYDEVTGLKNEIYTLKEKVHTYEQASLAKDRYIAYLWKNWNRTSSQLGDLKKKIKEMNDAKLSS